MTAPPAGALEACLALLEKATPGPLSVGNGSKHEPVTSIYCDDVMGSIVATCAHSHNLLISRDAERANAAAIAAAVNLLKDHGPALLAALRLREWRPIESAPKSSSHILLFGDGTAILQCVMVGNWRDDAWRLAFGGDAVRPTHWQPLPAPPTADDLARVLEEGE